MMNTDFSRADFSSMVPGVGENLTEEERRRRAAVLSGQQSFTEAASNYLGNRIDQAKQNVANVVNPVLPQDMQIAANQRRPAQQTQPAQAQPAQAQPAQQTPPSWTEQVAGIANDETGLINYLNNKDNPAEGLSFARNRLQQMWSTAQESKKVQQKVNEAVESGNLLPIMKEIKKQTGEGSLMKAYLYNRFGLSHLAKTEEEKLGAGVTYAPAYGTNGEKAIIQYSANGLPLKGFNEQGQELSPEALSSFAAGALGPNTKSFLLPQAHGTPLQKTIIGPDGTPQTITGVVFNDPRRNNQTYVKVGNQEMSLENWNAISQTPSSVYNVAGAQKQGAISAETGVQQPPLPQMNIPSAVPQRQPAPIQQNVQPQTMRPVSPEQIAQATPQAVPTPQVTQQPMPQQNIVAQQAPSGGIKLATPTQMKAPTVPGGGQVVTQRPGESYASFKQREKLAQEQAQANIQAGKEIRVAEQKPPAEARGKQEAKDINNQAFANSSYDLIIPINEAIKESTGSGIGTKVDTLASQLGASTKGAQAIAKLRVLSYPILANVPRFEGPQSDYDVQIYRQAAGDFANPNEPVATRLAALQAMILILKKYDKEKKNDWTFGGKLEKSQETKESGKRKVIKLD